MSQARRTLSVHLRRNSIKTARWRFSAMRLCAVMMVNCSLSGAALKASFSTMVACVARATTALKGSAFVRLQGPVAGYAHSTELTEAALRRAAETVKLAASATRRQRASRRRLQRQTNVSISRTARLMGLNLGSKSICCAKLMTISAPRDPRVSTGLRQPERSIAGGNNPASRRWCAVRGPTRWRA